MTLTAKFPFTCRVCGRRGAAGSQIEWSKADGAAHASCVGQKPATPPPARFARRPAAVRRAPRSKQPGEIEVSRKGTRRDRYEIGTTIHLPKVSGGGGDGHYWTVVDEGFARANEDFGDYDDRCWATVRPATDAEIAPVAERRAEVEAAKNTAAVAAGGLAALARIGDAVLRGTTMALIASEGHRVVMDGATLISRHVNYGTTTTWHRTVDGILVRQSHSYDDSRDCAYVTAEAMLAYVAARADEMPLADSLRRVATPYSYVTDRARIWFAAMRGEVVPPPVPPATPAPSLAPRELVTDDDVLNLAAEMNEMRGLADRGVSTYSELAHRD